MTFRNQVAWHQPIPLIGCLGDLTIASCRPTSLLPHPCARITPRHAAHLVRRIPSFHTHARTCPSRHPPRPGPQLPQLTRLVLGAEFGSGGAPQPSAAASIVRFFAAGAAAAGTAEGAVERVAADATAGAAVGVAAGAAPSAVADTNVAPDVAPKNRSRGELAQPIGKRQRGVLVNGGIQALLSNARVPPPLFTDAASQRESRHEQQPQAAPPLSQAQDGVWCCSRCTFRHDTLSNMSFLACELCGEARAR